jgi:very-short-patch-repair endonuclease
LGGWKFRRQQVVEGFVVDFCCAELRVAVELDGSAHDSPEAWEYDDERTRAIEARGVRIIRVRNASPPA